MGGSCSKLKKQKSSSRNYKLPNSESIDESRNNVSPPTNSPQEYNSINSLYNNNTHTENIEPFGDDGNNTHAENIEPNEDDGNSLYNNDRSNNGLSDHEGTFINEYAKQMQEVVETRNVNKVYIKLCTINFKQPYTRGSVSRLSFGELDNGNERIDVVIKSIRHRVIYKYKLMQYIFREVLIGISLDDSYCVKYYGVSSDDENIHMVMEQYGSTNLHEYMLVHSDLSYKNKKKMIHRILEIIKYLHDNNIIHRDIKLMNFLIKDDVIKICDFGAAIINKPVLNSYCGTLSYMSPHITSRSNYDKNVDLWAFGMLVIEVMSCVPLDLEDINNKIKTSPSYVHKLYNVLCLDSELVLLLHYIFSTHIERNDIDLNYIINNPWFSTNAESQDTNTSEMREDLVLSPISNLIEYDTYIQTHLQQLMGLEHIKNKDGDYFVNGNLSIDVRKSDVGVFMNNNDVQLDDNNVPYNDVLYNDVELNDGQ